MTDDTEWGPWIEHDGKGCPVVGQVVWDVREYPINKLAVGFNILEKPTPNDAIYVAQGGPSWTWEPGWNRVLRYRVRKPRALKQLRDMVGNLPAPERVKEEV